MTVGAALRVQASGRPLLKAQFDNATDLTNKVKHLEYIIGHYERWTKQLKDQIAEREPFSSILTLMSKVRKQKRIP